MNQKGISIIEILIVIFIITVTLTALLGLVNFSLKTSTLIKETTKANAFAQEMMEVIRDFRNEVSWNNDDPGNQYDGLGIMTTGIAYYPEKSIDIPPKWMLIQGEETISSFTRKIVFEDVSRDFTTDDIEGVYNLINDDPDTKKATVTVSWKNKKVELITYFTNWK